MDNRLPLGLSDGDLSSPLQDVLSHRGTANVELFSAVKPKNLLSMRLR